MPMNWRPRAALQKYREEAHDASTARQTTGKHRVWPKTKSRMPKNWRPRAAELHIGSSQMTRQIFMEVGDVEQGATTAQFSRVLRELVVVVRVGYRRLPLRPAASIVQEHEIRRTA
jgi:hypothetical protein